MSYRQSRFTSSGIDALIKKGSRKMTSAELKAYKEANPKSRVTTMADGFAAPGLTYITEKRLENLLGRSMDLEAYSSAMAWGNLMEKVCFEMLPFGYSLVSDTPALHPTLGEYWGGTVDLLKEDTVSEVKCYQLKKFALYTDMLMNEDIVEFRETFSQEYWQIVSNSIIYEKKYGEAISFMPYKKDIEKVRDDVENTNLLERYNFEPWQYRFICEKNINDLAWINEGGYFKNITVFRFIVPEEDKNYLTSRVNDAIKLLIK